MISQILMLWRIEKANIFLLWQSCKDMTNTENIEIIA